MCTLSIIRWQPERGLGAARHGVRIVVNRDESHDRPQAVSPRWRTVEREGADSVRAVWPTDPQAGGTWIAANEHGLTLCLLNRNPEPPARLPARLTSRGAIIPRLIDSRDEVEAVAKVEDLDLESFAPFRLVAAWLEPDGRIGVRAVTWERTALIRGEPTHEPICFASSGLGDSRVLERMDLFREMVVEEGSTPEAQDRFHAHVWPARRHLSVMMYRADARTVAVTSVEMLRAQGAARAHVVMHHRPVLDVAHAAARTRAALCRD